ncbi:hypothetical protein, partial [Campylobacter concisus]|uniref:hypothetical protein n=1 Tax=Campylobacter concisus TaxID=199 RepID=UPI001CB8685E
MLSKIVRQINTIKAIRIRLRHLKTSFSFFVLLLHLLNNQHLCAKKIKYKNYKKYTEKMQSHALEL